MMHSMIFRFASHRDMVEFAVKSPIRRKGNPASVFNDSFARIQILPIFSVTLLVQ